MPALPYWSGNEKLKGSSIPLPPLPPPTPPAPPPPPEERVDVAGCGGGSGTASWKLPAVGAAAGPIALNASACLGIEGGSGALVLFSCGGAAQFAVLPNGSITGGGHCVGALPSLRMAACDGSAISQRWTTTGGSIRLAMHNTTATSQALLRPALNPTNLWQFNEG